MPKFGQADTGRFFQLRDTLAEATPETSPETADDAAGAAEPDAVDASSTPVPAPQDPVTPASNGTELTALLERSERFLKATDGVDLSALAAQTHELLLESLDLEKLRTTNPAEAEGSVRDALRELVNSDRSPVAPADRDVVIEMVVDEVLGFGPIDPLLDDPSIQEIMVNAPDVVYVESDGKLSRSNVRFRDVAHVRRVAERILAPIGRRVDESSPMVDARLPDGSRVNITIPPATPKFPSITIRKFRRDRMALEDLMQAGSLDERMSEFLGACTANRLNILVSGGTGSGKTTLLNAISSFIPRSERIVTIEDPLELVLQQPHVISMEARPPDVTGRHAILQRDLLRNCLRMRPDRIIVGEVRGAEAFEMLQAMNTGHDGSLGTVHANTPRDALARIENMVLMAGFELPISAIREQIASALHLVIQLERGADGVRRIIAITEITGMEGANITMHDLFIFEAEGRDDDGHILGRFRPTGIRPTFSDTLAIRGRPLEAAMFLEGALE